MAGVHVFTRRSSGDSRQPHSVEDKDLSLSLLLFSPLRPHLSVAILGGVDGEKVDDKLRHSLLLLLCGFRLFLCVGKQIPLALSEDSFVEGPKTLRFFLEEEKEKT